MTRGLFRSAALVLMLFVAAGMARAAEPPRGSPERAAILDVLRPRVEGDIGKPVMFKIEHINVDAGWAYVSATPMRSATAPVDWSRTRFARAIAGGFMSDLVEALLRLRGGGWEIVEYVMGPSDVVWTEWVDRYHIKSGFFENGGPVGAAPPAPSGTPTKTATASPPATTTPSPGANPTETPPSSADAKASAAAADQARLGAAFKNYVAALAQLETYEKTGDGGAWSKGLEDAESATLYDPAVADYWRALGYAYSLVAPLDHLAATMAEDALEKAARLDPSDASAHLMLARLQMDRSSWSRALDNFEAALKLKRDLAASPIAALMCRAYIVDSQAERGARCFGGFVAANPRAQSARLAWAILLHETGRTADALPLARVVAENPQSAQVDAVQARDLEKAWTGAKP